MPNHLACVYVKIGAIPLIPNPLKKSVLMNFRRKSLKTRTSVEKIAKLSCNLLPDEYKFNKHIIR